MIPVTTTLSARIRFVTIRGAYQARASSQGKQSRLPFTGKKAEETKEVSRLQGINRQLSRG